MSTPTPSDRILIVDDEDQIRTLLARLLGAHGYDCVTAESAATARRLLQETRFALVLSDVNMPGESGIDFTREVLARHPDTAVVMVTGMDDRSYADAAIELGAYGYVLKPFKPNELIINVGNALRRRTLEIENRTHRDLLEQTVLARTTALRDTISQLESSDAELRRLREETIRRLSWAAEFRNQETGEHIVRMSLYCALLARLVGLDPDRAEAIRIASPMHDVGKIGLPDVVLLKPGRLTDEERKVMEARTPRWATGSWPARGWSCSTWPPRWHSPTTSGSTARATRRGRPATRSRSRAGSARSPTSSTPSPPTASTGRRSSRTRRGR
ncbi:MAG: response regulator [Gaiellaceae bacterium]